MPDTPNPSSGAIRGDRLIRHKIVRAGRELFTRKGFLDTTPREVAERAGVTWTALNEIFPDKMALFSAVSEELGNEIAVSFAAATKTAVDPLAQLRAGALGVLDVALRPDIQRIVLIEGFIVLPGKMREQVVSPSFRAILGVLKEATAAAVLPPHALEPLARVLLASITEASVFIAEAADPRQARVEAGKVIESMLAGLGVSGLGGSPSVGVPNAFSGIGQSSRRYGPGRPGP